MILKEFLENVHADYNNPDVREMIKFAYYEDTINHYELVFEEYEGEEPSLDTKILEIETSDSFILDLLKGIIMNEPSKKKEKKVLSDKVISCLDFILKEFDKK